MGHHNKSRPVLITFSVLAGLQVMAGGAALADVIGDTAFGLFVLVIAAVQAGMSVFVQGNVTPHKDVVEYLDKNNQIVRGPAAPTGNGY